MRKLEQILQQTDFSRDTDLKERLAKRLFSSKVVQGPFTRISDEDAELVTAAQGIYVDKQNKPEIE